MATLHLFVTRHWFDEYMAGRKNEEYRIIKPHWTRVFSKEYTKVCIHRGYSKTVLTYPFVSIKMGKPNPTMAPAEWHDKVVYIITNLDTPCAN